MFVSTLIKWTEGFWSGRFKLFFEAIVLKSQLLFIFFFLGNSFSSYIFYFKETYGSSISSKPNLSLQSSLVYACIHRQGRIPALAIKFVSKLFTGFYLAFGTWLLVMHTAFVTKLKTSNMVLLMAPDLRSSWSFAACFSGKCFHYYLYFLLQLDEASVFGNGISPD